MYSYFIVNFKGIWRLVHGTYDRYTGDAIFEYNGKMEKVTSGYYKRFPPHYTEEDLEIHVIDLNINKLSENNPRKRVLQVV